MKKALSIILAVLLIATTIPFAFAADSEKCVDGHDYEYRFCANCDEEMPADYGCVHQFHKYDVCTICGYVDENSNADVFGFYYDGYLDSFYSSRQRNFREMYGNEKIQEIFNNLSEEAKKEYSDVNNFDFESFSFTVGESKSVIDEHLIKCNAFNSKFSKCLAGVHNIDEYTSNNDATCMANGTKTGDCTFCTATDITVDDEGTKLDSCYTNDGDTYCDGCGTQLTCEDCGRPAHEGQINEYVCLLITFIKLVVSFFNAVK